MNFKEMPQHPKQRTYDLIFGLIFLGLGLYRMYQLYNGVVYSKFKIILGAFMLVLGVFKLYAYFKTTSVTN